MTTYTHTEDSITAHVPATVYDEDNRPNEIKVRIDGLVVLMCPLTFPNLASLQGTLGGGVATCAKVYDVLCEALERHTERADEVLPLDE
jgi:hypothetical protein